MHQMDQGCVVPNAHGLKTIIGKIITPLKSSQRRYSWTSSARKVKNGFTLLKRPERGPGNALMVVQPFCFVHPGPAQPPCSAAV